MRYATIADIIRAGFDVRIWCWECARDVIVDEHLSWRLGDRKQAPIERLRLRCKKCRSYDVIVLPARKPKGREVDFSAMTTDQLAGALFHMMRAAQKEERKRRGWR